MSNPYTQTFSSIRIVIADDHAIYRKGLSTLLKQHWQLQVVGEAANGRELVEIVAEKTPAVVLTDINMPGMCGLEATAIIRKNFPQTNVIALSMHDSEETIFQMLQAGARGYLLKNTDEKEMIQAVHTVHGSGMHYCSTASNKMMQLMACNYFTPNRQKDALQFSERDTQIIRLLCQEKCSKEIAATLNTSCRAVEGARQRIQEKMGARNMIGIALYAIRHGIFQID